MSTPTEHEALASVLWSDDDVQLEQRASRLLAQAVLASDWLAERDAALIAKAKAEGAVDTIRLAAEFIRAARDAFEGHTWRPTDDAVLDLLADDPKELAVAMESWRERDRAAGVES